MRVRSLMQMVSKLHDFAEGMFTLSRSDQSHAQVLNLPRYGSTGKAVSTRNRNQIGIVVQP